MIKLGNNDITLKIGSADVSAAYLGSVLVYNPVPPEPKWIATYTGGTTSSAECDSSSAITSGEISITDLVAVEIGSCVRTINSYIFYDCTGLTSVTIPDSVTTIGNGAFLSCTALTNVIISDSVTIIGSGAFNSCSSLTSVTIPDSVTSIGDWAFSTCTSLTSVTIGSGVTSIGQSAFYNCTSLTSITIPDSITSIGSRTFAGCRSLTSVTIPDSATSIGEESFYGCIGLTSVDIPSGVTNIDTSAFAYCNSLSSVTILATTPPTLGDSAFDSTNDCPIYVPVASVDTYKAATGWSNYASRIQAIPTPSPQWVTFNSGDDISGLNVYGVKGVALNLSNTFSLVGDNIYFELSRNIVNAFIGAYNYCYTDTYGKDDDVELIFGNIGCSDYYTLSASMTASDTIQLYIYQ